MLLETEGGIWARADATVFRLLMDHDRTGRRLQAANRTITNAHRRVAALRRRTEAADAREHARAAREIDRAFAQSWGRTVRVKVPRRAAPAGSRTKQTYTSATRATLASSTSLRAIRAYRTPLLDSRGRVALYFRIRYVGFKSKNWRPGLAADHALYILREAAIDVGETARDHDPLSNMGRDAEEIAACWNALEAMEEGYRANAKVQYRIIWNLPHDLSTTQRRDLVEDFCERTFGRLGLPWVAAVHAPDARGDQRNYHAHICFSTRPCERVDTHEWQIAQEKVNGLTDADGLKLMRALAAGHMNTACRAADLPVRFTHQTYKERGIDAERQAHIGPAAMTAHERGEAVATIERNARIVERNELAVERDAVAHEAARAGDLVAAIATRADVAGERQRTGAMLVATKRIAATAKAIARIARPAPVGTVHSASAPAIGDRAQHIAERVASRPAPAATQMTWSSFAIGARRLATGRRDAEHRHDALGRVRERLVGVKQNIAATTEKRQQAARARLLDATVRPYRMEDGRASLDLSAMSRDDAALVRTLDRDAIVATVRERIRRDRERDAAEALARRHAEDAQRAADERRARAVDEACRVVRDSAARPYRRDGTGFSTDLLQMDEADRAAVLAVGLTDASVQEAFRDRVVCDREQDAVDALARRQADDAQRAADERRARAVDESCRIVRDAAARPYRRDGSVIRTDLSQMDEADRAAILAIGLADASVQAAFRDRIQRDRAEDAHAVGKATSAEPGAKRGKAIAPSGQRHLLILAAAQRETLTAAWAETGLLHPPPTVQEAGTRREARPPTPPLVRRPFPPGQDQGR